MDLEQKIENIPGNLRDAYKQAVRGTLTHVDELMQERRFNPKLRDLWFYTADGSVYSMDNSVPTLRITREAVNPVLNHIDDAFDQLVNTENYHVLPADFEAAKAAKDTVTIDLTQLKLQRDKRDNNEWNYLVVNTSKAITEYNAEQQKLLQRVFGPTDDDYNANMKMLRESPQQIKETRVYVLNPQYVKKHTKESPIGRASWLNIFINYSDFYAVVRNIDDINRLRGVRRRASVSELQGTAGAPENGSTYRTAAPIERTDYSAMVEALTASRDEAVKAFDDQTASALLGMVSQYYSGKAQ